MLGCCASVWCVAGRACAMVAHKSKGPHRANGAGLGGGRGAWRRRAVFNVKERPSRMSCSLAPAQPLAKVSYLQIRPVSAQTRA